MQRDKVLGLSLAILLIGFAGAFCFRNETGSIFNGPQLQNARALDDAIADKEGPKPYPGDLQGTKPQATPTGVTLEGIVAETPFASSSDQNQSSSAAGKGGRSSWEMPDFLKPKPGETQRNLSQTQNAPAPITARNQNAEPGQDLWIPKHNQAWQTTTGKTVSATSPSRNENIRTHRVTEGDTLTGLAAQYLGSSARYKEIFEANRDVLQEPNDLRAGMVLRIPQNSTARRVPVSGPMPEARLLNERDAWGNPVTQPKARNVSSNRSVNPTPADFEIPKETKPQTDSLGLPLKQFVPVRRSPFAPRSSMSEPTTKKPRSLSQTPPADLPDLSSFQYFPRGGEKADGDIDTPEMPVLAVPTSSASTARKHTVRRGETLESIALQTYGSRVESQKLFEANRDRLRSPNGLREGITILLP